MTLTKRGEYALRALIDLGLMQELGKPVLRVSDLARKEKLPKKFLEQILSQFRKAGYVATKRGPHGGCWLHKPANSIVMGDVIRLIDGPLAPIPCVSQTAYKRCSCPDEDHCGLRLLMLDVRTAISGILDRFTLADVVEVTLRKLRRTNATVPLIEAMEALGKKNRKPQRKTL
ncbi:MAG TPA: Rrf2 family transcriptional regulator [Planctomycetota bacterium]|jgi:Rrf2 family protein|nr:Rrf2 family transcriptional regulator [Planctomycetota bacterium]